MSSHRRSDTCGLAEDFRFFVGGAGGWYRKVVFHVARSVFKRPPRKFGTLGNATIFFKTSSDPIHTTSAHVANRLAAPKKQRTTSVARFARSLRCRCGRPCAHSAPCDGPQLGTALRKQKGFSSFSNVWNCTRAGATHAAPLDTAQKGPSSLRLPGSDLLSDGRAPCGPCPASPTSDSLTR